jgi:hypothetical protein
MKAKSLVTVLVCVIGLTLFIGNAYAGDWYPCTVSQVGSTTIPGTVINFATVTHTLGYFTNRIVTWPVTTGNQQLAAALTAFANSTNVWVYLESDGITAYGIAAIK